MEKDVWNDYLDRIDEELYKINRNVSVNIIHTFDKKRKHDLMEINDKLAQMIKLIRRCKE